MIEVEGLGFLDVGFRYVDILIVFVDVIFWYVF